MGKHLYQLGCRISDFRANLAGHPDAIALVALFCMGWFVSSGEVGESALTIILSVLAISLTQMVLNQQRRSERALRSRSWTHPSDG